MGIHARIDAWEEAGLLDPETAQRLREHEAEQARPLLLPAIFGVGAVAITLGLVAIVAANWNAISGETKLALDLILGVALGVFIVRSSRGAKREIGVLVFYGYVLASIGLIGQVYHLSSPLWQPLLTWSLLTGPVLWSVRSGWSAGIWIAGLGVTHAYVFEHAFRFFDRLFDSSRGESIGIVVTLTALSPALYLVMSRIRGLDRDADAVARAFNAAAWSAIFAIAAASATLFYTDVGASDTVRLALLPSTGLWLVAAWTLPRWQRPEERPATPGLRSILVLGTVLTALALGVPRSEWDLLAALGQLAVLGVAAWTCQSLDYRTGFRAATFLIYVRLLIVYFEVFGSLLSTGVGLISGGVLALGMAWLWSKRLRRNEGDA